jgi:hypothetical protein
MFFIKWIYRPAILGLLDRGCNELIIILMDTTLLGLTFAVPFYRTYVDILVYIVGMILYMKNIMNVLLSPRNLIHVRPSFYIYILYAREHVFICYKLLN